MHAIASTAAAPATKTPGDSSIPPDDVARFTKALARHIEEGTAGAFLGYDEADYATMDELAYKMFRLGRGSESREVLGQLLRLDISRPYPNFLLGMLLLKEGEAAEAMTPLRRAAEADPDHALVLLALGQAQARSGDRAGAAQTARALLTGDSATDEERARAEALLKHCEA